ncbi:hypothetical protein [Raineyella sp. W15-4]|uniref:hypothetical protein n=1 Tax=Raineyella sp. W15-4 TaxID=3081651 RepID=UPI00295576C8|nr:hypothetical protein [Raineyella sp. W15-4]WOQ17858.1 hypothetical protein R0145_03885 [Raineyella sp. W15-4]
MATSAWGVGGRPELLDREDLADQAETWLRQQTQPQEPVIWRPEDGDDTFVHDIGQLSTLLRALQEPGDWGVLSRAGKQPWAQSMRVQGGWIVEVDGGTGPESFARRVQRIGGAMTDVQRCCADVVGRGTNYFGDEMIVSPVDAAQVLWAWICGGLPAGYTLRQLVEGID